MITLISILVAVSLAGPVPGSDTPSEGQAPPSSFTIGGTTYGVVPDSVLKEYGLKIKPIAFQDNAAFDYLRAMEVYWEPENLDMDRGELWQALGNPRWSGMAGPSVREYLAKNAQTLKHIKAGAAKHACCFPYLLRQGQEVDEGTLGQLALPYLERARRLALFVVLAGRAQEFEGDAARALDTYLLALSLGDDVAQEAPLINGLVGNAVNAIGSSAIERCLVKADDLDEEALADIQKRVSELWRKRPDMRAALRVEHERRARWIEYAIRNADAVVKAWGEEAMPGARAWAESVKTEAGADAFRREMQLRDEFIDRVSMLPLPEYLEKQDELKAGIEPKLSPMVREFLSSELTALILYGRRDLEWHVLDATLGLERYRAEHDKYPRSLDEVKDLMLLGAIDPLSGTPLRYRLEGDGSFTIWSVGEDLTNDGGEVGKSHNPWRGNDHVWNSRLLGEPE